MSYPEKRILTSHLHLQSGFRLILLTMVFVYPTRSDAQEEHHQGGFEITSITFDGNDALNDGELAAQLLTQETPGFFNKLLYSINDRLGRKNEYFDHATFEQDIERLRLFYRDHGFYETGLDTTLSFNEPKGTVDILIEIQERYRSVMDTIIFRGIVGVQDFVYNDIRSAPKIEQGDPFNRMLLEEEIARVRMILWNAGYANAVFVQESSWVARYASTRNCTAVITYERGKYYRFGDIAIEQDLDPPRTDITDDIILRQLDYTPGSEYRHSFRISSERNLNRLGIFDRAHIGVRIPEDSDTALFVPSLVTVRPRDRHEVAPEVILSDENNTFNLGTGIGYTHRNFLGGARTFNTRLRFRTQTIGKFPNYFQISSDAVANLDLTFEMLQPYIFSNKIKGAWTFSLILDKQKPYRQEIIRNKFGITDQLATFTTGFLDWTFERVALRANPTLPDSSTDPDVQKQINQLKEASRSAQFNSILSFTIQRDKSNDIFSPSDGFIHSATVEEAGLLPLLLKRVQPDLPFTQFYRVTLLGRWYFDLSRERFSILALKLKGGFEEKYGESRSDPNRGIPQTHRFYAGGGSSIRGWESRELSASGSPQLGGNLTFEGSAELRMNVFKSLRDDLLSKIWLVGFADVGNVWAEVGDFQFRQMAIATGFGFRYDTIFGPFRLDYGFRVYNPTAPRGQQWITQRRFFPETFSGGVIHFGIGHSF